MKAYKITVLIVDHDELGEVQIKHNMENVHYPNRCISPRIMNIEGAEIGEWDDDHPLNSFEEQEKEFKRLFEKKENSNHFKVNLNQFEL